MGRLHVTHNPSQNRIPWRGAFNALYREPPLTAIVTTELTCDTLRMVGPLVPSSLSNPAQASLIMTGYMLVDTGAEVGCIRPDVATQLSLPVIGHQGLFAVDGLNDRDKYQAQFKVFDDSRERAQCDVLYSVVITPPGFAEYVGQVDIRDSATKEPSPIMGVVGRDFLEYCKLTYDGPAGIVRLEIIAPLPTAIGWGVVIPK